MKIPSSGTPSIGTIPNPELGQFQQASTAPGPPDPVGALRVAGRALRGVWAEHHPTLQAVLMVMTAFDDFNAMTVGRRLDEESLTAVFLGHLASSARHIAWLSRVASRAQPTEPLRWLHYSKRAEAVVGADFALFVPTTNQTHPYRLFVIQAKKSGEHLIDIARPGNWKQAAGPKEKEETDAQYRARQNNEGAAARANANKTLEKLHARLANLTSLSKAEAAFVDTAQEEPQWQLTKMVMQRLRLRSVSNKPAAIRVCYAIWPEESGTAPLYAGVEDACLEPILPTGASRAVLGQFIPTSALRADLRQLLIEAVIDDADEGLSVAEAVAAYRIIAPDTSTIAILSLGAPGPTLVLEEHLKLKFKKDIEIGPATAALPPLVLPDPTQASRPKNG